jgi:hypothetical protein
VRRLAGVAAVLLLAGCFDAAPSGRSDLTVRSLQAPEAGKAGTPFEVQVIYRREVEKLYTFTHEVKAAEKVVAISATSVVYQMRPVGTTTYDALEVIPVTVPDPGVWRLEVADEAGPVTRTIRIDP